MSSGMSGTIQVRRQLMAGAVPGYCLGNVEAAVSQFGGEIVLGWHVARNREFLSLCHHAVWKSPSGELVDITPDDALIGRETIEFRFDNEATPLGEPAKR